MFSIGISVICSTNRIVEFANILDNFLNQDYEPKELIITINTDVRDIKALNKAIKPYSNIKLYNLGSGLTLGECLNFAVAKAKYPIIAKFDSDDYYGPLYLSDTSKALSIKGVGIAGKSCIYIYFSEENIIGLRYSSRENSFVNRVTGSTLMFRKELFDHIKFSHKNLGEDIDLCKDCMDLGYKIYSTNRNHYVYIRNKRNEHTWKISNDYILNQCSMVYETNDYKQFIINNRW